MNVLKHSGTLAAQVSIHHGPRSLEVVVEDPDVLGAVPQGSFGLFSVREQVGRIGGTLELTSAKGHGTRARVQVSL